MLVTTDPDEFMDVAFALSYMPLPRGRRVAVATMGGGWGVLVADELARCGLELAEVPEELVAELDKLLPPFWSHANPIDLVATITPGIPEAVVELLAASDAVDAIVVLGVVGSLSESRRATAQIERLKAARAETGVMRAGAGAAGAEAGLTRPEAEAEEPEVAEPELSERELAFIQQTAALMDRYCKPIANISIKPLTQSVFSVGGRFSTFMLPSPLRAVRVLAKMADYSDMLVKRGRPRPC
ncbi:MAG: hypothetical protein H5T84_05500 [Thermoleophilia bacterium]|nr:hypothetical protein [Thermoleophilia bacterium]